MNAPSAPVTVTQLTQAIVVLFESNPALRDVWVTGEVSNWKRAASGHVYFRLKDGGATINAVMWKGAAQAQGWLPRDGDQVLAHGYVGVYPEGGAYQLYANILRPAGKGQLYARFEELKARLAEAGLFDAERKQPLPVQPRRIGVVTSPDAAALRDILRVLSARWPLVEVTVFPCLVQGADAPGQIAAALAEANRTHQAGRTLDVIILGRGGGSIEDLWAFNDERVANAVAASELPVICGVGHETDFTIADFVADLRAPTPSAAAAAAVPDRGEVVGRLRSARLALQGDALGRIQQEQRSLDQLTARLGRVHPRRRLDVQYLALDERIRRLQGAMGGRLQRAALRRVAATQRLYALSPARVLARGYSIVVKANGTVVRGPGDTTGGEVLRVRAAQGDYQVARLAADAQKDQPS